MKALSADEDNSFVSKLPKKQLAEYNKLKSEKIKEIKKQFDTEYREFFSKLSKGIKEDQFHKVVLNSCIFPFVQKGLLTEKLDYTYIRSSPLLELKVKNVDFLIVSQKNGLAIFGEAKGSIDDPSRVISEYKQRIEVINNNYEYVKKFVPSLSKIEFVLGVPSMDAMNTVKAILRSNVDIIVWATGGIGEQQLSLVVPPNVDGNIKKRVMHLDNELNRSLNKVPTSEEYKTFFHESHPVTKMGILTWLAKRNDDFSFDDVKKIVSDELDNTSDLDIEQESKNIISLGIDIDFVTPKADGNYTIHSRRNNSKSRFDELQKKWIGYRYNTELSAKINEEITKLGTEFIKKHGIQTSL